MINQLCYQLGSAPSMIRQLFSYGLEQSSKLGADKVYDYSIGNPSIPAPKKVNESIHQLVDEMDSVKLHGDSMAFSEKAKLEYNLLVVPADGFSCPGYFRLSYCVSNDMIRRSLPVFQAMMDAYQ